MSLPVIYIGGSARSGSTLLERLLARDPSYCAVGELVFIWDRGLQRNDLCGCGERFRDCKFWDRVGEAAFGGWDRVDIDEAARLRAVIDRHRNLDRVIGLRPPGTLAPAMEAYEALTTRLYQAVREVSGAAAIVDSSKQIAYAFMLRGAPGIDLRLIHLVRRVHGVVHSWSRQVLKPSVGDGSTYMSVHSASWAVGLWVADNLLYDLLARRTPQSTLARYEDLLADLPGELSRILDELGMPTGAGMPGAVGATTEMPESHALSGNPMRFRQGGVSLRVDDEWRSSMARQRRMMVSAATWPLLRHYGYPMSSGKRPG